MSNWYEENIEEGIRKAVRLLRDNGINTTYSCEHMRSIEAENYEDNEIGRIYELLIENGYKHFRLSLTYFQMDGCLHKSLYIQFF